MSGRRKIDLQHPDCTIYRRKFEKLWSDYRKLEEAERAKYPDWRGLDHPADEALVPAYRECCKKMKELQQEYAYLFTKEAE